MHWAIYLAAKARTASGDEHDLALELFHNDKAVNKPNEQQRNHHDSQLKPHVGREKMGQQNKTKSSGRE